MRYFEHCTVKVLNFLYHIVVHSTYSVKILVWKTPYLLRRVRSPPSLELKFLAWTHRFDAIFIWICKEPCLCVSALWLTTTSGHPLVASLSIAQNLARGTACLDPAGQGLVLYTDPADPFKSKMVVKEDIGSLNGAVFVVPDDVNFANCRDGQFPGESELCHNTMQWISAGMRVHRFAKMCAHSSEFLCNEFQTVSVPKFRTSDWNLIHLTSRVCVSGQ